MATSLEKSVALKGVEPLIGIAEEFNGAVAGRAIAERVNLRNIRVKSWDV